MLAGFKALQLVKLPKDWSLCLGRASVFGNTLSFCGCLDPRIFSELSETSFVWKLPCQKMGWGVEVGAGRHSYVTQNEKLNINMPLLLPAWKPHSHNFLTCIVVVRVRLSLQVVLDSLVPHFGSLCISCNRLIHPGLTFQLIRKLACFGATGSFSQS